MALSLMIEQHSIILAMTLFATSLTAYYSLISAEEQICPTM